MRNRLLLLIAPISLLACGDVGPVTVLSIHAGDDYNCAIVAQEGATEGRSLCWGNDEGQPSQLFEIPSASELVLGSGTYCARSGVAWRCWGDGSRGQFGTPDPMTTSPVQLPGAIAELEIARFGGQFLCSTNEEGELRCWGAGDRGQLGNGGMQDVAVPRPITLPAPVRSFALGKDHACVVSGDLVLCWGAGENGKNGSLAATDLLMPTPVTLPADATTAIADPEGPIPQLVLGDGHSCLLAGEGVWCWGDDSFGQLGQPLRTSPAPGAVLRVELTASPGSELKSGANHVCVASPASELVAAGLVCWGDNSRRQLGSDRIEPLGPLTPTIGSGALLAVGRAHACAMTEQGVACWGAADRGQLGALRSMDVSTPAVVQGIR